jgi:hypothetical protein
MSRFSSPSDGRPLRPRHVWEEDGTNSSTGFSSVKEEGYAAICMTWRLSQISALKLENHLQGLAIQVLGTRLPHLSSLVSLRLCNQHVDEILAQTLAVGLQANHSVKQVSLQGCQFVVFGSAATTTDGSALSTQPQTPSPSWSIFVAGVVKTQQLEILELDSCSLTCRHIVDLENALAGRLNKGVDASRSVCRLKRLGLNGNHLASLDSVLALSSMLQREDSQLESLDLDGCLWYPPL